MVIVTQGLSVVQLFTVIDVKKKEKRTNFKSVLDVGSKIKPSAESQVIWVVCAKKLPTFPFQLINRKEICFLKGCPPKCFFSQETHERPNI